MEDARARFFSSMEGEMEVHESVRTSDGLDIDFSITESGRTVAHMVQQDHKTHHDDMDFSITSSGRTLDHFDAIQGENNTAHTNDFKNFHLPEGFSTQHGRHYPASTASNPTPPARSIPIPQPHQTYPPASLLQQIPSSQASSQGSSGSAFLSSMLNQGPLSHTPPVASSYEVSHFGKRARSGSVSGRLRSASDYLEEKGLLDRQTKGILKDLIIIGDEELQVALDRYEAGDPSTLEQMISSGALEERLPKDLDILGDLDLDFLTVHDDGLDLTGGDSIEPLLPSAESYHQHASQSQSLSANGGSYRHRQAVGPGQAPNLVSPAYDDGIGDLDFSGEFVEQAEFGFQPQSYGSSKQASVAASPTDHPNNMMSEYERRMRSNSLFSALLDPRGGGNSSVNTATAAVASKHGSSETDRTDGGLDYGQWMDRTLANNAKATGIQIGHRRSSAPASSVRSGISASLEQADRKKQDKKDRKEQKALEKLEKKQRKEEEKEKKKQQQQQAVEEEQMEEEHVPGSGRPRALSDPNLHTSLDQHGLMNVTRPDGWVGAYSPESRKVRVDRFMEKRNHRVWTKTVKYDVRKNFADSRLRVKGRFVKKEDELLMRELMSMT
jgi:hypothetical protein